MILTPYKHNIYSSGRSNLDFSIAKSFYFDGVNQYATIPNSSLNTALEGTNKKFTFNFCIKFSSISNQQIFSNGIIDIQFSATGISFIVRSPTLGILGCNYSFNTTDFNFITIVVDTENSANNKILIDNVEQTLSNNTLTADISTSGGGYSLFRRSNNTLFYNGYCSSISVINRLLTTTEITNLYKNGKPKNPQSLFGADCVYFFNPDNSGDTAQFSVTNQGITATSFNMTNANKTPITPYQDKLADLVTKYGFLNAWSFENQTINGTTSTLIDYKAIHDLSNPAVANQWTFIGGDANINNRPSGYFVTDDYAYKSVANYNSAASTGSIHAVFTTNADVTAYQTVFASADEAGNDFKVFLGLVSGKIQVIFRNNLDKWQSNCDTTTILTNTSYVVSVYQNGSTIQVLINGVAQSLDISANTGTNPELFWFLDIINRDNIAIGSLRQASPLYSDFDIAFVGVSDDFADATVLATNNELKTIFGI